MDYAIHTYHSIMLHNKTYNKFCQDNGVGQYNSSVQQAEESDLDPPS